jgi:hypothetical protein
MAIEINADDVASAESFLETLLTEEIPEGRFTQGSALRDLVVKSMAFTFAHLQKENTTIKSLQSLLNVRNIAASDPDTDRAVANATDAILSNWFINRKAGSFARGMLFVEVTRKQDYVLAGNQRFTYDRDHVFYPDVVDPAQNVVISASSLFPVIALDGTIQAYQFSLRVIAAKTGADFNVAAGNWVGGTSFSAFATRVFSAVKFTGGKGKETTNELIARSNNAIAVRNLINPRSIDATLREKYSYLNRMLVVGMGEPEMQRDVVLDYGTVTTLHVGGHYDVFLELPRVQATFEGRLGDAFVRPDGIINVFKDASITDWTVDTTVQAGDVIRVGSGLDEAPKDFVIKEVYTRELRVSENTPFSVPTEESVTYVSYNIYRPLFTADIQIYPTVGVSATGYTSRAVRNPSRLILPAGVHYDIIDVAVLDPDTSDLFINPSDGFVHFPTRVNQTPVPVTTQSALQFQITNSHPNNAFSMISMDELILESAYDGKNVRVVYETLSGLDTIHDFTRDRFERVVAGNILVKGFHQAYLTMTVPYRYRPNATAVIDETLLRQTITDYVNAFDPNDVIDVSDISTLVRGFSAQIGAVLPFEIGYTLIVPDGRTIEYSTADEVRLYSTNIVAGQTNAELVNPVGIGISDRTVRYVTTLDRIYVENRD